jgi:hypothetical protein
VECRALASLAIAPNVYLGGGFSGRHDAVHSGGVLLKGLGVVQRRRFENRRRYRHAAASRHGEHPLQRVADIPAMNEMCECGLRDDRAKM